MVLPHDVPQKVPQQHVAKTHEMENKLGLRWVDYGTLHTNWALVYADWRYELIAVQIMAKE